MNLSLLDLLGNGYVIEHCIAVFQKAEQEKLYRIYTTDCLKLISENTAGFVNGKAMSKRFYEIAYNDETSKQPEKSAEEIVEEVTKNAGLVVIE